MTNNEHKPECPAFQDDYLSVAEHNPKNEDCHYECKGLCNAAMPFCTCNYKKHDKKYHNNGAYGAICACPDEEEGKRIDGCTCKNLAPASVHFKDCPSIGPTSTGHIKPCGVIGCGICNHIVRDIIENQKSMNNRPIFQSKYTCRWHGIDYTDRCPECATPVLSTEQAYAQGQQDERERVVGIVKEWHEECGQDCGCVKILATINNEN